MMSRNNEIERRYFERFATQYSLPHGSIEYGDKPDVILNGPRTIGIEITHFYLSLGTLAESEQQQRPLRENLIKEAHRRYLSGGGKKIELAFDFDKENPIKPAKMEKLISKLAKFACLHQNDATGGIYRSHFRSCMPEIAWIYLNANLYPDAKWRIMQSHSVNRMCVSDLEDIVRSKEAKSTGYKQCGELWLLIIVDGMNAAQEQEIRIDNPHVFSDVFERIIIFHTFGHIVHARPSSQSIAI